MWFCFRTFSYMFFVCLLNVKKLKNGKKTYHYLLVTEGSQLQYKIRCILPDTFGLSKKSANICCPNIFVRKSQINELFITLDLTCCPKTFKMNNFSTHLDTQVEE